MTEASARPRRAITAHPITSATIAILIAADIFVTLYLPLYARITPKVGAFPFFYFYPLILLPVTSAVLWVVTLLQKRLSRPAGAR
jgi:hypothetical protein